MRNIHSFSRCDCKVGKGSLSLEPSLTEVPEELMSTVKIRTNAIVGPQIELDLGAHLDSAQFEAMPLVVRAEKTGDVVPTTLVEVKGKPGKVILKFDEV